MEKKYFPVCVSLFGISCIITGSNMSGGWQQFFFICADISLYIALGVLLYVFYEKKGERKILGMSIILSGILAALIRKELAIYIVPYLFVQFYSMAAPFLGMIVFVRQFIKEFDEKYDKEK